MEARVASHTAHTIRLNSRSNTYIKVRRSGPEPDGCVIFSHEKHRKFQAPTRDPPRKTAPDLSKRVSCFSAGPVLCPDFVS